MLPSQPRQQVQICTISQAAAKLSGHADSLGVLALEGSCVWDHVPWRRLVGELDSPHFLHPGHAHACSSRHARGEQPDVDPPGEQYGAMLQQHSQRKAPSEGTVCTGGK